MQIGPPLALGTTMWAQRGRNSHLMTAQQALHSKEFYRDYIEY